MRLAPLAYLLALSAAPLAAESGPQQIPLWPNGAPGFEKLRNVPEKAEDYWVKSINNPSITVYRPEPAKANGAAVVILPGGGHSLLVITSEGADAARYFTDLGVTAFVLKYRLEREPGSPYKIRVHALADARRAIRTVRAHAAEWNVDPKRVGIMGFSAGGELVGMEADTAADPIQGKADAVDAVSSRPDFQILVYPGPLAVPEKAPVGAPPAFLVAANDDPCCSGPTIAMLQKFREAGVPAELHLFSQGSHAFNMGQRTTLTGLHNWPARLTDWLNDTGWLKPAPAH
jgi:acetyl esterase/lipase